METKEFIKGKDYLFESIENCIETQDVTSENVGGFSCGESFLVLRDKYNDTVISFCLTGYTNQGVYTCVFNGRGLITKY